MRQTLHCEQCGALLTARQQEVGCVRCLLRAGMEPDLGEASSSPADFGTRSFQHYRILLREDGTPWELGRGAMGVTYKAVDVNLQIPVALKVLNGRFSSRPDAHERFLHEAQAAARLRHPNVASVFHFGVVNALPESGARRLGEADRAETLSGDCFYAMEFVEGETLEARLRRLGPLSSTLAVEVGLQVARALAAAERCGLVHRDIKPANLMLLGGDENATEAVPPEASSEVWVKVIDFGLAQAVTADEDAGLEAPKRLLGTPAFASPEQMKGSRLDVRSDIYSLGCTLWYSLTAEGFSPRTFPHDSAGDFSVARLRDRGVAECLVKALASMLAMDRASRPVSAALLVKSLQSCQQELRITPPDSRARRHAWVIAGGIAALLLAALGTFLWPEAAPDDKSVAVLPFRNLSADPANSFLVDGLEDDMLSNLVKIRDLKVIGRHSTANYLADAPRDLRAIGKALGVRHVLEGSLRRTGNRVVLQVALIDTRDAHTLWAETYDRTLADSISLEGELAAAIADALDATLTKQEQQAIGVRPTRNTNAYLLYLRGRKLESGRAAAITDYQAAEGLYSEALTFDPKFALAHARLATTLSYLYHVRGPSNDLNARAHAQAREALRLLPGLGEGHLALGLCYYHIDRDFPRALPELELARRLLPNDAEPLSYIAYLHRREGKWRTSIAEQTKAQTLDPRNMRYDEELFASACLLRNWPDAAVHAARMKVLAPELPQVRVEEAYLKIWAHGDLAPAQKVFAELTYGDSEGDITWAAWDVALQSRDFALAHAAIERFPFQTLPSAFGAPIPKSYLEGCVQLAQGHAEEAQQLFDLARPAMEAESSAHPQDGLRHARLGLLYSYMGRKGEAIREGELATKLPPMSADAYDGPERLCNLALIHGRVGDNDAALAMIESLLRIPGCVSFYEASLSLNELRLRWQWDPLRTDPRFQKILVESEPATIY